MRGFSIGRVTFFAHVVKDSGKPSLLKAVGSLDDEQFQSVSLMRIERRNYAERGHLIYWFIFGCFAMGWVKSDAD